MWLYFQFVPITYILISLLIPDFGCIAKSTTFDLSFANFQEIQTKSYGWKYQPHCEIPDDWFSEYSNFPTPSELWPEGRVTYKLHPNLSQENKDNISQSFDEFHKNTCIRFEPRFDNDTNNQPAYLSIEPSENVKCAMSSFCYKNAYQFMRISPVCFTPAILIHQLGHSLCLPHEHQRKDRDDHVDFSQCGFGKEVPQKLEFNKFLSYPYDYLSQMHHQCDKCNGGLSKAMLVYRCGLDVRTQLSTLDADKINELYDCHGCFRHRWRSTGDLTNSDKQAMIPFGFSQSANQSTYLCRASVGGEIIPGTYRLDENVCYVPFFFEVLKAREHVQVFTLPQPRNSKEAVMFKQATYRMIPFHATSEYDRWVPVGQKINGMTTYAAVASLGADPRYKEYLIGNVYRKGMYAHFPFRNRRLDMKDYDVLVCSSNL